MKDDLTTNSKEEKETLPVPTIWERISRVFLWLFTFFIFFLIIAQSVFWFYTDEIVGTVLKQLVQTKSNGLYYISYDAMELNILTGNLDISGFFLQADSSHYDQLNNRWVSENKVYEMEVSEISIEGAHIAEIYFKEQLSIKKILIEEPSVSVYNYLTDSLQADELKVNNSFYLISDYLKLFRVDDFRVHNGSVGIQHYNDSTRLFQVLENISVAASGFQIDSTAHLKDGRPFNVNDIVFDISNNTFNVRGFPYELRIDRIFGGTKAQKLNFQNVMLTPWENAKNKNKLSEIHIPALHLVGLDFREAYFKNNIVIEKATINTPSAIIRSFQLPRKKTKNSNTVADSVNYLRLIKGLAIDTLLFQNGNILINTKGKNPIHLPIKDISFMLSQFKLDSTYKIGSPQQKKLFSKSIELEINNLNISLPDSLHQLRAKKLFVSTSKNKIFTRGLRIYPKYHWDYFRKLEKYNKSKLFDISVPYVGINNINIWNAYLHKKIKGRKLQLYMPDFKLFNYPKLAIPDTSKIDFQDLFPLVSSFVNSMYFDEVIIDKGKIQWNEGFKNRKEKLSVQSFDFTIKQLNLHKNSHLGEHQLLHTAEFDFSATGILKFSEDSLQKLLVNQLHFFNSDSSITVKGFSYEPTQKAKIILANKVPTEKEILNYNISNIDIKGFDMKKALHHQLFFMDSLRVVKGKTIIYNSRNNKIDSTIENSIKADTLFTQDSLQLPRKTMLDFFKFAVIKELEIENISVKKIKDFNTQNPVYSADSINLYFHDFQLDGFAISKDLTTNYTDTVWLDSSNFITEHLLPFDAKDAVILGKNFHFPLADSLHILEIKAFGTASIWNSLFAEKIRIKPNPQSEKSRKNTEKYNLAIASVWFDSLDTKKLYHDKKLKTKTLQISQPFLFWDISENTKKQDRLKPKIKLENLYDLIKGKLELIDIKNLQITDGSFDILQHLPNKKTQSFFSNDVSLTATNFLLDSNSELTAERFLYADDVRLKMEDYTQTFSDSIHSLDIEKLVISTSQKSIFAENVGLYPEFDIYSKDIFSKNLYEVFLPKLKADTLDFFGLYTRNIFDLQQLEINAPRVNLNLRKSQKIAKNIPISRQNWYKKLAPLFKSLHLANFRFNDLELGITTQTDSIPNKLNLRKIEGKVTEFLLDSSAEFTSKNIGFAKDISLQIEDYGVTSSDSLYKLKAGRMRFSTQKSVIKLEHLDIVPIPGKYDFARKEGFQTDYMTFKINQVRLAEMDLFALIDKEEFRLKTLNINGLTTTIFRDKRLPINEHRFPKMLRELLLETPYLINIDTFSLSNSYLGYEELALGSNVTGTLFVSDFNLGAYNLTNDSTLLQQGISSNIYLSGYVMGEGLMQMSLNFPLTDSYNSFSFKGTIGSMDITKMNPILENIAFVKVVSGINNKLVFNILANEHYAKGLVHFYYDDFKIDIINRKKSYVEYKKKTVMSFFANTVLNNKNPRMLFLKKGKVYYKRDPHRSVVHYIVHSLLSGIKPSVGLNTKTNLPKGDRKYDKGEFGE